MVKNVKFFWIILSVVVAVGIFLSSSMPGDESGSASLAIAVWLQNRIPLTDYTLNFIVRKTAHFAVYFALGFCVFNSLKFYVTSKGYLLSVAWGITAVYGVIDEIHQYFVPGRVCSVLDMVINASGAVVGVFFAYCAIKFFAGESKA